ncbi:MAG: hypothetical protein MI919_25475 [Holophagales bacterium]|nr:hypothetical protein [Holophagales bacterium]
MSFGSEFEHSLDKVGEIAGDAAIDSVDHGAVTPGSDPFGSNASKTPVGAELNAQQSGRLPGAAGAAEVDEEAGEDLAIADAAAEAGL